MRITKELKNFTYFGFSEIGSERENNEDRFDYVSTVNGDLFIVCDGMGGVTGGEIASEKAVESLISFISDEWYEDPQKLLTDALIYANKSIIEETRKYVNIKMMGTTAIVVLLRGNRIYYAHIGDSRIYYKTGRKLFILTKDHSYVQELVDKKILTKAEAKRHSRRNEITKALGISHIIEPDICSTEIKPTDDDYILLCTDGLSSFVSEKQIMKIINLDETLEKKVNLLIKKAEDEYSDDNITIQLVHFYNTGEPEKTHSYNKKRMSSKKLRLLGIISFLIFITGFYFFVNLFSGLSDNKNRNITFFETYSKAYTVYTPKKDTVIVIFFKNNIDIAPELEKLNVSSSQVGYATALKTEHIYFAKFYVPVKNIRYIYPGENIFWLSALYKVNVEDILTVNNKNELFLFPSEKIIIPKSEE